MALERRVLELPDCSSLTQGSVLKSLRCALSPCPLILAASASLGAGSHGREGRAKKGGGGEQVGSSLCDQHA